MVNEFVIPDLEYSKRELTVVNLFKLFGNKINSFLNIGFRNWLDPRTQWWIKICKANNIDWKIVEIFQQNVIDSIANGCNPNKIILGNIRNIDVLSEAECIFFWHGSEHIEKDEFIQLSPKLEAKYAILVFGTPFGEQPQDEIYGNEHEKHLLAWNYDDWKILSYTVEFVFDNELYPHITAFKILKK